MNPRLIVMEGPLKGSVIPLPEGEFSVGRSGLNQLSLSDTAVSRQHCTFFRTGAQVTLRDSGSHNGTQVNGQAVSDREVLPGDKIRIGASLFVLVAGPSQTQSLGEPATQTIQLRLRDSVYLDPSGTLGDGPPTARDTYNLRLLLRLSGMLHSFRALHGAQGLPTQGSLSRHLMAILMDIMPAGSGGVLVRSTDPATPFTLLAESTEPLVVNMGVCQRVASLGVAVLANAKENDPFNILAAPVLVRNEVEALLYFSAAPNKAFDEGHLQLLTAIAGMAATAWENASMLEWLREENEHLQEVLKIEHGMVGESAKLREIQKQIARAAPSSSTVLILGESGTGKELIARAIHRNGPRANGPFVAINCAALTDTLLESELFGYEKGAFTGAQTQRKGKLEAAEGGTVFLDEIGELSMLLQAKLLRVLQERELQRVGGTQTIKLDIRLVAATNRDLAEAARKGDFRLDLYYRLNVVTLKAPALRQRPEDILPLAEHFAKKFAKQCGRRIAGIAPQTKSYLRSYSWPGNVRELENAIERAVVLGNSDTILPEDLPENIREERPAEISATLFEEAVETAKRQVVLRAFEQASYEHEPASKLLGLHPNYLHRLIRTLGMKDALKSAARGR